MDNKLSARFDAVMASLKPIEPSAGFDFEFGRRLREAALTVREEPALVRAAKLLIDKIRYDILPQAPVLVRVTASFVVVFSVGLYIYGSQPMRPDIVSGGRVLAGGIGAGYTITTGEGETVDIILRNKYEVRVKENSKLRIAKLSPRLGHGTARLELAEGEVLASIEKGYKGSKFEVKTPAGLAGVMGTKFAVDVERGQSAKTIVAVLEGNVRVAGAYHPKRARFASNAVMVGAGQKTEMSVNAPPERPERLMEADWLKLEDLYQIGKKPQVVLLLKNVPGRVYQLLKPCPLYVSDEKPRDIPMIFDDVVRKIEEALNTGELSKHLEAIRLLEKVVDKYPNPKYSPQFLLYIGSYYGYIGDNTNAIRSFERVIKQYPRSQFASLAQAATGVVYEDKMNNRVKADEAFKKVLKDYPDTLEAILAEEKLGISKVS